MKVAIVGGGISGLVAGFDLAKAGHTVTVFEKDHVLGGLCACFRLEGTYLEKYYHHFFTSDQAIIDLFEQLGLSPLVEWRTSLTGVYYDGHAYPFGGPLDLLRFKPLPLIDRFRLGFAIMRLRKIEDWKPLEEITAKDFIIREMGEKVYRVLWEPLLRSKFGDKAESVAAVWFWGKIKLRGSTRTKSGNKELLGYLRGGLGLAIDELAKQIADRGGRVLPSTPVERIGMDGNQVQVTSLHGVEHFDRLVFTGAPSLFANLCEGVPEEYRQSLLGVHYQGTTCLVLKTKQSLSNIYWLNINDINIPFVGIIEHTNYRSASEYGGYRVIYVTRYLDPNHRLYSLDADDLFREYTPHIKRVFPQFDPSAVEERFVFKDAFTQPVIGLHYSRQIPDFATPLPGVCLASMAQIYPEDRGSNYGVVMGHKASEWILASE